MFEIDSKTKFKIDLAIKNGMLDKAYKSLVKYFIEKRYDTDDEMAIHRQKDVKEAEWNDYNRYCEDCKAEAKKYVYKQ